MVAADSRTCVRICIRILIERSPRRFVPPILPHTESRIPGGPDRDATLKKVAALQGQMPVATCDSTAPGRQGALEQVAAGGAPTDRALIVQGVADLAGQVLVAIGLDEKANGAGRAKSGKQFWIGEARREHDANLRPSCACCPQEVDAIEVARHDDVAKNDVHDLLFK